MGDMMEIELFAERIASATHDQREAMYFLLKGMEIQKTIDSNGGGNHGRKTDQIP